MSYFQMEYYRLQEENKKLKARIQELENQLGDKKFEELIDRFPDSYDEEDIDYISVVDLGNDIHDIILYDSEELEDIVIDKLRIADFCIITRDDALKDFYDKNGTNIKISYEQFLNYIEREAIHL